jgi:hypothetical protein
MREFWSRARVSLLDVGFITKFQRQVKMTTNIDKHSLTFVSLYVWSGHSCPLLDFHPHNSDSRPVQELKAADRSVHPTRHVPEMAPPYFSLLSGLPGLCRVRVSA